LIISFYALVVLDVKKGLKLFHFDIFVTVHHIRQSIIFNVLKIAVIGSPFNFNTFQIYAYPISMLI